MFSTVEISSKELNDIFNCVVGPRVQQTNEFLDKAETLIKKSLSGVEELANSVELYRSLIQRKEELEKGVKERGMNGGLQ